MDPYTLGLLTRAYIRRVQFEAKVTAVELSKILSGGGRRSERVDADTMVTMGAAKWV